MRIETATMIPQLTRDEIEERYNAWVAEYAASPKALSDRIIFRHRLARLGFNATAIDDEIRERK